MNMYGKLQLAFKALWLRALRRRGKFTQAQRELIAMNDSGQKQLADWIEQNI